MKHQRMHGLEKIQVELAAVAALLAVHFWFGPGLVSADPLAPITFLPLGETGRSWEFLMLLLALAAFCAIVTISSRPEGALLAVLIGVLGVSFLTPPIRSLLWLDERNLSGLYLRMIGEVLLLWAGLVLATLAIDLVRGLLGLACPQWVWRSPLAAVTAEDRAYVAAGADNAANRAGPHFGMIGALLVPRGRRGSAGAAAPRGKAPAGGKAAASPLVQALSSAGLGLLLAMVFLKLLLQSPSLSRGIPDRGQILFALALSFGAATLIANQTLPTPYSIAGWGLPCPIAVFFYALAALSPARLPPVGWTFVSYPPACALPIDWLAAGAGGAVLGYWISYRLHELRILERLEKLAGAGEA